MCIQEITLQIEFKIIICIGIAGGISDDLKLGDVVVANTVFDISERAKVTDRSTQFDTETFESHEKSCQKLAFFKSHPSLIPIWENWQLQSMYNLDSAIQQSELNDAAQQRAREITRNAAEYQIGSIVSGPVGQSKRLKTSIRNIKRKMLALETESGGVYRVGKRRSVGCLTIRGISDYSDGEKKQHENQYNGVFRKLAIKNAASFLMLNLTHNNFFRDAIVAINNGGRDEDIEQDRLNQLVEKMTVEIHEALGRYSSEFRAKPKGYVIPVPRVRVEQNQLAKKSVLEPDEIISSGRSVTFIEIPANYPEKSLPWIFADYYIRGLAGGKIVLPLVMNFESIIPPGRGFSTELDSTVGNVKNHIDCVFIVHNVSETTKNRMEFFISQIESLKNAHLIVIGTSADVAQLMAATKWYSSFVYTRLIEISFLSITRFLASNFGMPSAEAETIAYKLRSVFKKYEISTHPSYFASLSLDAISSLIAAHRRSELINIGVQSYLAVSHVVDKGDKKLSITTRRAFLKNIAHRIEVAKQRVKVEDAIKYAKELSDEMDFDVNADYFFESLVNSGILEVNSHGFISFTLPFIRSYLVAESLVGNEQLAMEYFDFESLVFDQQAYDIFFEIHHSEALYERLVETLSLADKILKERFDIDRKIFMSSNINPILLRDSAEIQKIEKAFERYAQKINDGVDSAIEKQKHLDLFDKVRIDDEEIRAKIHEKADQDDFDPDDFVGSASRKLLIGIVTLSAGSENLSGSDKRVLSGLLLSLSVSLLSIFTSAALSLDLEDLRNEFKNSSIYADIAAKLGAKDARELAQLVDKVWALVELKSLSDPFLTFQNIFAENAGGKLLYKSIHECGPADLSEELIQKIWLLEIDPAVGYDDFVELLKRLPKERFLRTVLAQYLIVKAYWTQTSSDAKRILVGAAAQCVKPFKGSGFDTAKFLQVAEHFAEAEEPADR